MRFLDGEEKVVFVGEHETPKKLKWTPQSHS